VAQQPQGVPAFNSGPPPKAKPLPPILSGAQLENFQHPVQVKSYKAAAKIPGCSINFPATAIVTDMRDTTAFEPALNPSMGRIVLLA